MLPTTPNIVTSEQKIPDSSTISRDPLPQARQARENNTGEPNQEWR